MLPAAGQASRLGALPCSKEILPILYGSAEHGWGRPRGVCLTLLQRFRHAGLRRVFVVLRQGKWDIPAYLGDGSEVGLQLAYLMMQLPFGPPYSLDQAYLFTRTSTVAFGFPDILFKPDDAYSQLLDRQRTTGADVVLGLFKAHRSDEMDMIARRADGTVDQLLIKPRASRLEDAWAIAVWTPPFTEFMHTYLAEQHRSGAAAERELSVGHVIAAAIEARLSVDSLAFPGGRYLDIGTPAGLAQALASPDAWT